jgi:ABC-type phosphate transport system permease subunit
VPGLEGRINPDDAPWDAASRPVDDCSGALHRQAWAGALVLVSIVLICSALARLATRRLEGMVKG